MPMDRAKYPHNWEEISTSIRFGRARGQCEMCGATHQQFHPDTGAIVILTVHHIDHDKMNSAPTNLLALCQRCHLNEDRDHHIANRKANRITHQIAAGQQQLQLDHVS